MRETLKRCTHCGIAYQRLFDLPIRIGDLREHDTAWVAERDGWGWAYWHPAGFDLYACSAGGGDDPSNWYLVHYLRLPSGKLVNVYGAAEVARIVELLK